ncbi:MAG: ammonium transporter [Lentisphaeria bacterium]|nr:ammonium transporter [Lentisphaeria bacterium]
MKLRSIIHITVLGLLASGAGVFAQEAAPDVTAAAGAAADIVEAAADGDVVTAESVQMNLDIVFTAIAAFLVFFMQAGFAMVESGFTRAKNACNIMMKNLMDFSMGTIGWLVIGFTLMFGAGNGFLGDLAFFGGKNIDVAGGGLSWTFWIFQCVFAGTAATIVSGAMAGRTKFISYLAYSAVICAVIYPISGHWAWAGLSAAGGSGWLESLGFLDFAGSTVVHSCGAWLALAGAVTLGARKGKYTKDGKAKAILGHNIPMAALGVFILWFGWFGFNPGSQTAGVSAIGYIAITTNLAAAAGAISAMAVSWVFGRKPDVSMALNGVLAGLVSITAGCDIVTLWGAVIIGAVAGILVYFSVIFIDRVLKIDDPVGAVSVHGVCGAFGTVALVFFHVDGFSLSQLGTQLIGVAAMFAWAFGCGMILFNLIKFTIGLRASEEEEIRGLDIGEHGNEAYSGFQIFSAE